MINFFRHIRKSLIEQNKMGKYLKYAIGEIILVMIGILLALAINSWNQNRLNNQQELVYLENLKDDLLNNIDLSSTQDSIYKIRLEETSIGFELFKNNPSIKDFKAIDSLIGTNWNTFEINRSTYDEMLNNGTFYSIQNKALKDEISNHYILAEGFENDFLEINSNGQDLAYNKDIHPLEVLVDRLQQSSVKLKGIDTTWIHNPNSPIYNGFYRKAKYYETTNAVRRRQIKQFTASCENLINAINEELGTRN